jgi:hypothetical protein
MATSLLVQIVLSIVISEAKIIGPKQNVYLKDVMYRTEKKIMEARQIDRASKTCDEVKTFSSFCFLLCTSCLLRMAHILPNAIISSRGARHTTNTCMSLLVFMQNNIMLKPNVSATRLALTFLEGQTKHTIRS